MAEEIMKNKFFFWILPAKDLPEPEIIKYKCIVPLLYGVKSPGEPPQQVDFLMIFDGVEQMIVFRKIVKV